MTSSRSASAISRVETDQDVLLRVTNLQKSYGDGTLAIEDVSLAVHDHEFVSIVGPSGCGKTTLLKTICALLAPSEGSVELHGQPITTPPPEMVLVFQDYARSLFPWLTVLGNTLFPLKRQRTRTTAEKLDACRQAIDAVGLSPFERHYPWQLSGGMQQRVAIARAIAFSPEILLLDEPFASIDALTRADLEDLTLRLRDDLGITMLLVTHDIEEAIYCSDRVVVLSAPPSTVLAEIEVPLPMPRNQITTRSDGEFLRLRNHIRGLIGKRRSDLVGTASNPASEPLHRVGINGRH